MRRSGSKAYCGNITAERPAYENPNVLDTTGAWDTFMGCALSFVCENGVNMDKVQLEKLLDFSNAAASKRYKNRQRLTHQKGKFVSRKTRL